MPRLNSTHVANAEYDEENQELEVTFQNGDVYVYVGVPVWLYNGLINAIDPGGFFRTGIKGKFSYEKVASG